MEFVNTAGPERTRDPRGGPSLRFDPSYHRPLDRSGPTMSDAERRRRLSDWFRQWRAPLRKFLIGRRAVPISDLDDVAQEVFLRLIRYERTELIEHPQAYLFKMASNVAAEWSIRTRDAGAHDPDWLGSLVAEQLPQDAVDRAAMQEELERALLALDGRQREVLKLQFYEGLTRAEIAARLGVTERTVKRVLMKSYERLRREVTPELLRGIADGRE